MTEKEQNKVEFVKMNGINRLVQLEGDKHLQEQVLLVVELY